MQLSAITIMVAIQAIKLQTDSIMKQMDSAEDPLLSELDEELHTYSTALMELKGEYIKIQESSDNLPSYEELVR